MPLADQPKAWPPCAVSFPLKTAAQGDANLMAPIIECARARVSEGEMVAALQEVFGTYTEHPQF